MSDETTMTSTDGEPVFVRYVHTCCDHADAWKALAAELGEAAQKLHDAIDDFNAGSEKDDDARRSLCWLCGADGYDVDGVVHNDGCALPPVRKVLRRLQERQG